MREPTTNIAGRILLSGATGYVGGRLLPLLEERGAAVRCLARSPERLRSRVEPATEVVRGDVLDRGSLDTALAEIDIAFYLVHLMASSARFEDADREAAHNFAAAAEQAGVRRIIYLGGLGDAAVGKLSPHLRSRQEVGEILRSSAVETIEIRAGMVIGSGSTSYQFMKSLTERLPVMICPRSLATPTQPVAIDDILAYLLATLDVPSEGSRVFEVGTSDVTTYGAMIKEYARLRGLRRLLIPVPLLTPHFLSLWLGLVTPATAEVGRHLIEGLRNPTVVKDSTALEVLPVKPMSVRQALANVVGT